MEVRIKTAEEFHASHVTIEIRAARSEVSEVIDRLFPGEPEPVILRERDVLLAEQVDQLRDRAESAEHVLMELHVLLTGEATAVALNAPGHWGTFLAERVKTAQRMLREWAETQKEDWTG